MEENLHVVGLFIAALGWFIFIFAFASLKVLGCLSN
jgi:hypothetical protein